MKLFKDKKYFWENINKLNVYKDFGDGIFLNVDIVFLTDKFLEYQKDLFSEFIADIEENLSYSQDYTTKQIQSKIEDKLQAMNNKLITFSEKIHDVDFFTIRWNLQIFFQDSYMSSMIWDISTVIFRDWKVNYMVDNDLEWNEKINIFSEFIEWELEDWDKILTVACKVSDIVEKSELQELLNDTENSIENNFKEFDELVRSRISNNNISFISFFRLEFDSIIKDDSTENKFWYDYKKIYKMKDFFVDNKFPISIVLWIVLVIYLLFAVLSTLIEWDKENIVNTPEWQVVIDFTVEDLTKDIDLFRRIPADSNQKMKKYKEIEEKLDLLEQTWRFSQNIKHLKSILNSEYLKWFNIVTVSWISSDYIYSFTDDELETLWDLNSVVYNNWLNISWNKWALLKAVNDEVRWTSVNYDIPVDIEWCTLNILENGMYCFSSEWDIFNVVNSWIETVSASSEFESNITWIGTYWSSNFYTIFNDEERFANWQFIAKYSNTPWSQTSFGRPTYYDINKDFFENNKNLFSNWFTNISIDWSFLTWSVWANKLVQFHRWTAWNELNARTVPISWWPDVISDYWKDVDVLSYPWSNLLYTLDRDNNIFTVYRSAPYKTNTAYIMDYTLQYFFSLKFDSSEKIISAYVDDWEAPVLYLLTNKWVARYNIYNIWEWFDS